MQRELLIVLSYSQNTVIHVLLKKNQHPATQVVNVNVKKAVKYLIKNMTKFIVHSLSWKKQYQHLWQQSMSILVEAVR